MAKEFRELKEKPKGELQNDLAALRHKLLDLRMKREGTELKNVKEIRETRKSIARLLTAFNNL